MRKVLVIGIGAGDPDHITLQAIKAMQQVDAFFVINKSQEKEDLLRVRREICERHLAGRTYRMIEIQDPHRDRGATAYRAAVETWHEERRSIYEALIRERLAEHECGAFLVWGDPSLYDSTIRILEQIAARGTLEFEYQVIPGISSIQALAARHRIALNQIGESITITTGRKLSELSSLPSGDVVVLLDGHCAFKNIKDDQVHIYWAAYLGTEDEILICGKLIEIAETIERVRAEARRRKGWLMDTYLLRKNARP